MSDDKKMSEIEKNEAIEKLFQEAMSTLKKLHNDKLEIIKRFRADSNLEALNKIRESLKEQV